MILTPDFFRSATAVVKSSISLWPCHAGWSKAKIIATIVQRQRSGKPLGYAAVRRDNPRLVSAAEAYFGSWGNALHAAGIDLNLYLHRKWRKRKTTLREITRYGNLPSPIVSAL